MSIRLELNNLMKIIRNYGIRAESAEHNTYSGYASTNTRIFYFATELKNTFKNLGTCVNSNNLGLYMTTLVDCYVYMNHFTFCNGGQDIGISIDSTQLTTNIDSISLTHRRSFSRGNSINEGICASWGGIMEKGSTIRPHGDGVAPVSSSIHGTNIFAIPLNNNTFKFFNRN